MLPTAHLSRSLHEMLPARNALGEQHPLVRVLELQDVVRRDLLVVSGMVPALIAGLALGFGPAPWLLGGTGCCAAVLAFAAMVLHQRRRALAVELIVDGRADLAVAAVVDEARRLLDPAERRMLARSLARIRTAAHENPPWLRPSTLPYHRRTVLTAAPALVEIERLLQGHTPGLRGIALAQRLLIEGASPLYGHDAQRLNEELHRIIALLRAGTAR